MKRIALLFLSIAMAIDISQQAYNSDLVQAIARRSPNEGPLAVIRDSSVMTTIEYWLLFLAGFGLLSLLMAMRGNGRSRDIID